MLLLNKVLLHEKKQQQQLRQLLHDWNVCCIKTELIECRVGSPVSVKGTRGDRFC